MSLAWLAIGFNLAAGNSPPVSVHERSNTGSHCDAYVSVSIERTCDLHTLRVLYARMSVMHHIEKSV